MFNNFFSLFFINWHLYSWKAKINDFVNLGYYLIRDCCWNISPFCKYIHWQALLSLHAKYEMSYDQSFNTDLTGPKKESHSWNYIKKLSVFPLRNFITIVYYYFFNCYLAVPWPILGHSQGDSLTNLTLITAFVQVRPEGHQEPRNEVGSLSPAERLGTGNLPILLTTP